MADDNAPIKSCISYGVAESKGKPGYFRPIITIKMESEDIKQDINFVADITVEGEAMAKDCVDFIYRLMNQKNPTGMFMAEKFSDARDVEELTIDPRPEDRVN